MHSLRDENRLRNLIIALLVAAVLVLLVFTLFRLSVVEAADENSLYVNSGSTYTVSVPAARGLIYDSLGRTLVDNALSYSLVIYYHDWERDGQNATILRLIDIMNAHEETYCDSLPIGFAPYTFFGDPDGADRKALTRFIKDRRWSSSLGAEQIMEKLYERYDLTGESYTEVQKRVIAGVRYEMEIREFRYSGQYTFAQEVSYETVALIKENAFTFPGVEATVQAVRSYETDYAAHLLGRVGMIYAEEYAELKEQGYSMDARIGKDGAEKAFEPYLRGKKGIMRITKDTMGNTISENYDTAPETGSNVFLTIDLALQQVAEDALADRIEEIKKLAETKKNYPEDIAGGAAIVMDVNSCKVLAMASYPTYDLETFNADYSELLADELTPMLNRAIGAAYPPASTFKMIPAIAGLETDIVTRRTHIDCKGIYTYYKDYRPRCWYYSKYGRGHGELDVVGAISNSCNCYFYEVGRLLGIETIDRYAEQFGFGQYTGIELAGEVKGWRSNSETKKKLTGEIWYPGDVLQTSIGQSYTMVTPIQLCTYISAIANGGTLYRPTILDKVTNFENTAVIFENEPEVKNEIPISQSTRDLIIKGMLNVTEDGTASSVFANVDFSVAGKTGSAEVPNGSDNAVFAAFAPVDEPEIAVVVIVEHGNSGNSIAPIARTIFEAYFDMKEGTGLSTPAA